MAHLLPNALVRKLRARINALEERMDVPQGLFATKVLGDHPLLLHAHMHLLMSDLDTRLANMDATVEGLGRDVCTHQKKVGRSSTSIRDTIRLATQPVWSELALLRGEIG